MSLKSITLATSLFLILSFQSNNVWASYSPPGIDADDEIEAAQSVHDMAPLLDPGQTKGLLRFEAEQTSSKKLSSMMLEKVSDVLQQQEITPFIATPLAFSLNLIEEYDILNLAKRLKFSPLKFSLLASDNILKVQAILKESSLVEKVKEALDQPQLFYQSYVWDEILDEAALEN